MKQKAFTRTIAALLLIVLLLHTITIGAAATPISVAPQWPGPIPPGRARVTLGSANNSASGQINISNQVLVLSWRSASNQLRFFRALDVQSGNSLTFTGELFKIALEDGRTYPASGLVTTGTKLTPVLHKRRADRKAGRLAAQYSSQEISVPLSSTDGQLGVLWRVVVSPDANYFRQELEIETAGTSANCLIKGVSWLNSPILGAHTCGEVDGSPIVANNFFLGAEDPHALNRVQGENVSCQIPLAAPLVPGQKLTVSFVLGVAPPGQLRRGFLYYLERERAHPYRPFLHYNSWYDIAWSPFALNETNCLDAIRAIGDQLVTARGVTLDSVVFDDGWDDPRTLWHFHSGFPRGFAPLAKLCDHYHTRLGVWLSPFGGYGEPRAQRLKFGSLEGFETNSAGFALAGPNYYQAFKQACLRMIRRYHVNQFKFDGIAAGTYASGGGDYLRDTEAMRRLMLELRRYEPSLYINLTTGSWPSPFWLRYADSLWRQGGDMGLSGKGPHQQQWLTYRDQEAYRNIVSKGPLFPLNSLMTQGVAYSRNGSAGDPSFNSKGFKDDVHAFFGSGTSLQELYIQPARLSSQDWDTLAEAARWSSANSDVLVDTHWLGGDPGKLEIGGYASWGTRKGIISIRNPDDQPHDFTLDLQHAFELPDGAPKNYSLKSPWAEDGSQAPITASAEKPFTLKLEPFQVLVLEAAPVKD